MSDIMDEFEFKPLTDGLGFHKKTQTETPRESRSLGFESENLTSSLFNQIPNPPQPKGQSNSQLTNPLSTTLPRPQKESAPLTTDLPSTTVDEILKTLNQRKRPEFTQAPVKTKIDATPEEPKFKAAAFDFSAFLLDIMLILAMNLLCLITLLVTTKIDLFANLYKPDAENMIYLSLLALFAGTSWIYLVATRTFMGCTPGEWVFDQRLGLPEETGSAMYSLLVMARATLVIASGAVFFPLLSMIMNRDILGRFMGLQLMKKI